MEQRSVPAPLSLLQRVTLELEYLTRGERLRELRHRVTLLEFAQQELRATIQQRLGALQREVEDLRAEVQILEVRLSRLLRVSRPLSDEELDSATADSKDDAWREECRRQQSSRGNGCSEEFLSPNGHEAELLRRLYRMLARLLHPDLARDDHDRLQREHLMRLVNQAWERRDVEQLQRLVAVWSAAEEPNSTSDLDDLRRCLAQREVEEMQLSRRLRELERSDLGQLLKRGPQSVERYLQRQEELLRHDIAVLRLRRRRLLRLIEERRRELALRAGCQH
ncbi:J domain-containing protein [Thermomicrobium sp. CFH 73360]|uniref:J domain-containing protein n=1 Tax=Thermomicrobium sp. CFH 73360 TaxID=2951987 RepID=UPI0020777DC2|nr:J domain-containing protein [Thermomicrobium sp. CFH 73360]MCM8746777.1 J domain-containing protein [Thermomicrobium sp. CFH 73360]